MLATRIMLQSLCFSLAMPKISIGTASLCNLWNRHQISVVCKFKIQPPFLRNFPSMCLGFTNKFQSSRGRVRQAILFPKRNVRCILKKTIIFGLAIASLRLAFYLDEINSEHIAKYSTFSNIYPKHCILSKQCDICCIRILLLQVREI